MSSRRQTSPSRTRSYDSADNLSDISEVSDYEIESGKTVSGDRVVKSSRGTTEILSPEEVSSASYSEIRRNLRKEDERPKSLRSTSSLQPKKINSFASSLKSKQ